MKVRLPRIVTKEYEAYALSKKNYDSAEEKPTDAWVYKVKIENNNLIVWGSMRCKEDGKTTILPDEKRAFKLSNNVDLGLGWLGSKAEQIKYFNQQGEDLNYGFFFRTVGDEVTYIMFAG